MTQLAEQGPMATPEQVAQAQESIRQVRKIVARFHNLRRKNNERAAGLRPAMLFPQQVQEVLRTARNPQAEQDAVNKLRDFLRILRGHEPTRQEMQEGIPSGAEDQLGIAWIPATIIVSMASASVGVYSVFSYLTEIEESVHYQAATPLDRLLKATSDNLWGVAAVGVVGLGAAYYYKSTKKEEHEHELEMEKARSKAPRKNPEEESLTEKLKNALFPPEKNPSLSPGEQLARRLSSLSKEEQEKFYASLNGDDVEEEEDIEEEDIEEEDAKEEDIEEEDIEEEEEDKKEG